MQNPVSDERYSVADEAILGAFFKLVKKKTTDQITVSDITKTAGIARSTFYNHYQDIQSRDFLFRDEYILIFQYHKDCNNTLRQMCIRDSILRDHLCDRQYDRCPSQMDKG